MEGGRGQKKRGQVCSADMSSGPHTCSRAQLHMHPARVDEPCWLCLSAQKLTVSL